MVPPPSAVPRVPHSLPGISDPPETHGATPRLGTQGQEGPRECGAVLHRLGGKPRAQWPLPPETQSMARTEALEEAGLRLGQLPLPPFSQPPSPSSEPDLP